MDIVFTRGNKVLRVFCNVPESYTLDDLRRDVHVIGSPLTAHIVESAELFLYEWKETPNTAVQADEPEAADALANVLVAAWGR
jgi:hypothetical protein